MKDLFDEMSRISTRPYLPTSFTIDSEGILQFATISRPTRVHADAEAIQRRLPGQDCFPEHEEALRATVQRILGEMTTMRAGDVVGEAEDPPSIARAVARQTARLAVVDGELAEQAVVEAGVDQNVLRRDLAD